MKLAYSVLNLDRSEPFIGNKGCVTKVNPFLIRLRWKEWTGLGTAIVAKDYGLTHESVRVALDICATILEEAPPYDLEKIILTCEGAVPDHSSSAIAAIDMAIHDLVGKIEGLPISYMLGLMNSTCEPTALSLGLMAETDRLAKARQIADWPILKLKMSSSTDIKIVGQIRKIYRGRIWIDGNGSWNTKQAIAAAQYFHQNGVELLEQPICAGSLKDLQFVHKRSPIPIVADEDCIGRHDVLRLQGCASIINIKLFKCGGLRRALEMINLAHQLGFKVMLGCKTESVLGITAIAQLSGIADYLDLDGHLDLVNDPFCGLKVDCGRITLPKGPGLGVTTLKEEVT